MRKIIIASALALAFIGNAFAETGKERQAACSQEWKQHKVEHGTPKKGEGRKAYNDFRKACTIRHKEADKKSASK